MIFFIFMAAMYLVPTIVAASRGAKSTTGIVLLNLFLGWTLIGWIAALCWAAAGETQAEATAKMASYYAMAELARRQRDEAAYRAQFPPR